MVSRIHSFAFHGLNVLDVDVQIHVSAGIPCFTIVGLADKTVGESRERVRAALHSIGVALPPKRITVNLAPADTVKEGSHFDLAIAAALLVSLDILPQEELANYIVLGELSLDGKISPVPGILPAAMGAVAHNKGVICPAACGSEALWAGELDVVAPSHLLELINHFKGTQLIAAPAARPVTQAAQYLDMQDVRGQEVAKRVLEIAAAGGHHVLMSGPPGAGKSMLASRLNSILPPLTAEEILECSTIASITGKLTQGAISAQRPFRAPHHSCSMAAMVGGGMGKRIQPGEVTLAHNGVLFLDELPEFPRMVLDSLRQPIESGNVLIARAHSHVSYPARFQLIAAMNPCRCGHLGDPVRSCGKAPACARDYQTKISGPILDRIDLLLDIPAVSISTLHQLSPGEPSQVVAARVRAARQIQTERLKSYGIKMKCDASEPIINATFLITDAAKKLLHASLEQLNLSMRGYTRMLRVARTIADLSQSEVVDQPHLAEALAYRASAKLLSNAA